MWLMYVKLSVAGFRFLGAFSTFGVSLVNFFYLKEQKLRNCLRRSPPLELETSLWHEMWLRWTQSWYWILRRSWASSQRALYTALALVPLAVAFSSSRNKDASWHLESDLSSALPRIRVLKYKTFSANTINNLSIRVQSTFSISTSVLG